MNHVRVKVTFFGTNKPINGSGIIQHIYPWKVHRTNNHVFIMRINQIIRSVGVSPENGAIYLT